MTLPGNAAGALALALPALTLCGTLAAAARAEVEPDPLVGSELPAASNPHWVWVNDFVFQHMVDGKAFLVDGDAGRMLGMLSTGFGFGRRGDAAQPGARSCRPRRISRAARAARAPTS